MHQNQFLEKILESSDFIEQMKMTHFPVTVKKEIIQELGRDTFAK